MGETRDKQDKSNSTPNFLSAYLRFSNETSRLIKFIIRRNVPNTFSQGIHLLYSLTVWFAGRETTCLFYLCLRNERSLYCIYEHDILPRFKLWESYLR